jgi:peptidoglycan hydrolase CwlO-like protein
MTRPTLAADLAAAVARLEASNAELRRIIRQLQADKRNLATENLSLLHRARLAEDRLRARDHTITIAEKNRANPDRSATFGPAPGAF